MTIKEKLSKIDPKVWVGTFCSVLTILLCVLFAFNDIARMIFIIVASWILGVIIGFAMIELYLFILKKLGLVKENPIKFSVKVKIVKPEFISKEKERELGETSFAEEADS